MKFDELKVKEALKTLKYEDDEIHLEEVYPLLIAKFLGGNYSDINIVGGRDMDYEGTIGNYSFNGSALYGNCKISLVNTIENPLEEKQLILDKNTFNKFYNTSPTIRDNYVIQNVPPIKDNISEDELANLEQQGILKRFYVWKETKDKYTLIYAKNEQDARYRILAIWGDFNEIVNEEKFIKKKEWYHSHPYCDDSRVKYSGTTYVLEWKG